MGEIDYLFICLCVYVFIRFEEDLKLTKQEDERKIL